MEIVFDPKADALYIKIQHGKFAENRKINEDTIIDLDVNGNMLGIEMLNASKRISNEDLKDVHVKIPF